MTGKQVWYPGKSQAPEVESSVQERGWGSQKQQAASKPRVRKRETLKKNISFPEEQVQRADGGYSTIEKGRNMCMLDYSSLSNAGTQPGTQLSAPELCGWQDKEELLPSVYRRAVQNRGTGIRLTRQESRGSQRQREASYEFHHFQEAHDHIEHYRTHYCYTTLSTAPTESGSVMPELVEQSKQALFKLEVKSLYRGDLFLRELATRLGVGEPVRDPQLLVSNKHTPPSIVKKHKTKLDLAIDLTPKSRSDEGEDDLCSPGAAWAVDSTKTGKHSSLELPRIPEVAHIPHKNNSTISHLSATSHCDEGSESNHTHPNIPTSNILLSSVSSQDEDITECTSVQPSDLPLLQTDKPLAHTLNKAQKEKLMSRTAHSLGLSSREWAAPPTYKQMNKYLSYLSRPSTQQAERGKQARPSARQCEQLKSSTGTTQNVESATHAPPTTRQTDRVSRPSTRLERTHNEHRQTRHGPLDTPKPERPRPHTSLRHKHKLDQLKSIYKSSQSSNTPPPTRASTHLHTRPPTRTKRKDNSLKLDKLDGSLYWNELPNHNSKQKAANKEEVKKGFSPVRLAMELSSQPSPQSKQPLPSAFKQRTRRTRIKEAVIPGASPQQIAAHLSRLKQKIEHS